MKHTLTMFVFDNATLFPAQHIAVHEVLKSVVDDERHQPITEVV